MANKTAAKAKDSVDDVVAPVHRSLEDLYVFGRSVSFDDGTGDIVEVWLQKISPADERDCIKPARAAKARVLMVKHLSEDSEDKMLYTVQLEELDLTREQKVTLVLQKRLEELQLSKQEEIAEEDEWSDEDYLRGLQDAWNDGLRDKWLEDNKDPEASKVYGELKRYADAIDKAYDADRDDLLLEFDHYSEEELNEKCINALIEIEANSQLVDEYRIRKIYHATRKMENHDEKYFKSPDSVRHLQEQVFSKLEEKYDDVSIGVMEGKD